MTPRVDADQRAGLRFAAAGLGLLVLSVVVGVLAALVQGKWDPLLDLDEATTRRAEGWHGLVGPAEVLTHLGDPLVVTLGAVVTALLLVRGGHRRLALFAVLCRLGALLLSTGIKAATDRARPVFQDPVSSAYGSSFPSGHALGAAAFYASTAIVLLTLTRRRWVLVPAALVPLVVAGTRVVLGVHYLSDVTVGLVLGFGWVAVLTTLFALWSEEEGHPVEPLEEGLP